MKWLHISDLHFKMKNYHTQNLRTKMLEYLKLRDCKFEFILITGDILYKYEPDSEVVKFIKELAKICDVKADKIFIVPGNHDINRHDSRRNEIIEKIRDNPRIILNKNEIAEILSLGHDKFMNVATSINSKYKKYKNFDVFLINNSIRIIAIDTTILSKDDADEGRLSISEYGLQNLSGRSKDDNLLNIVFMHHSYNLFTEEDKRRFQNWIDDNHIDVVYCGHSHQAGIEIYANTDNEIRQFTCGATIMEREEIPSFYIVEYDNKDWILNTDLIQYSQNNERWVLDNNHLRAFKEGHNRYHIKRKYNYTLKADKIIESDLLGSISQIEAKCFRDWDRKFCNRFGLYVHSSKDLSTEKEFSSLHILHSLTKINMPYGLAIKIVDQFINSIVDSDNFESKLTMGTSDIRDYMFHIICCYKPDGEEDNEKNINAWASRYARKYGQNEMRLNVINHGLRLEMSISFIENYMLKDLLVKATEDAEIHNFIDTSEYRLMTEEIKKIIEECSLYVINYKSLLDYLYEIAVNPPHPWFITEDTKRDFFDYNLKTLKKHLNKMKSGEMEYVTRLEIRYHAVAIILGMYYPVIGCEESSPIHILTQSIQKQTTDDGIVPPYLLEEMKKDLSMINWDWKDFRNLLDKLRKHTALPISIEEINSKIVSGKELTVNDDYVSIADLAVNLYEYNESKNRSIGKVEYSLEFVSKLFNYNTGFTCMEIRYESFYVKPSWSPLESKIYGLDKSIFVLMTNYTVETDKIDYLISKADRIDAVFIMKDDQQPFDAQKKAELLTRLSETNMAVLFFDIDEFKEKVNNKYPRRVIAQLIQNKRVKACISTTIML